MKYLIVLLILTFASSAFATPMPTAGPGDPPRAVPLLKCDACSVPYSGVLFPEWKAKQYQWYRIEHQRVTQLYDLDKLGWKQKEEIYTLQLKAADQELLKINDEKKLLIKANERTWFERNGLWAGFGGGVILTLVAIVATAVATK